MKKRMLFIISFSFSLLINLSAQDWEKVEIQVEKITENIFMLSGRGGNIGVCTGPNGTFVIDDQFAPLSDKILKAIDSISNHELKYVINTHWHGDHTGGNENMTNAGATIVAQENVRKRMSTKQDRGNGRIVDPSPEAALPVITFKEDLTFHINGEDLILFHVHNAHTDGDAIVYFPKSNVIHMGDTYFNGRYPFIDLYSGGTINGIIDAANQVLMLADENTKIIPGHGKLSNKKELTTYRDVLMDIRDRVKKAIKNEMTYEEIKEAKLTKDLDDKWGQNFINGDRIVDFIYTDLTRAEK